jgi:hypothetical protein
MTAVLILCKFPTTQLIKQCPPVHIFISNKIINRKRLSDNQRVITQIAQPVFSDSINQPEKVLRYSDIMQPERSEIL